MHKLAKAYIATLSFLITLKNLV